MTLRLFLAASLLATIALTTPATAAAEPTVIPREDLQSDLVLLRRALEQIHPGLWRYHSTASFERAFDDLRRALDRPTRLDSAFVAVGRFAATLRCGHTHAGPYNQGKRVMAEVVNRGGRVPFHFRWIDRRMVVTRELGTPGLLPRGSEVLGINGTPVRVLLSRMLPLVAADGSNDAKRISDLEVQGRSRYELFDLYLPLLEPQAERGLRLSVRTPSGSRRTLEVAPLNWQDRVRDYEAAERAMGGALPWTLDLSDSSMAVLRMLTWAVYNSPVDWDSTLNAMMDQVVASGRRVMVVDLRDNSGGVDAGDVILQRMIAADTRFEGHARFIRYRRTPPDLDAALDTWDEGFRDHTADTPEAPAANGLYPLSRPGDDADGEWIRAKAPRFMGRLFVLVSAVNSSATFQFADKVQSARLGTLVGRPTGGNQRGINGGESFFLRLPKSRIEVDLPVIGYYARRDRPDAGLTPDILVRHLPEDVAVGRDPEMDAVRRELSRR